MTDERQILKQKCRNVNRLMERFLDGQKPFKYIWEALIEGFPQVERVLEEQFKWIDGDVWLMHGPHLEQKLTKFCPRCVLMCDLKNRSWSVCPNDLCKEVCMYGVRISALVVRKLS